MFGNTRLVPIFGIGYELEPLVWYKTVEFIRAGAGRVQRVLRPIIVEFPGAALANHHHIAEAVREKGFDKVVLERHRVVVDLGY